MDKSQFFDSLWSQFGWDAYDESTVPEKDDVDATRARLPYITYMVIEDEFEHTIYPEASLWDYGTSWERISNKAKEISEFIGYGGYTQEIEGGYVWIQRGHPFAQRLTDNNDMIRRIMINIEIEFFTKD